MSFKAVANSAGQIFLAPQSLTLITPAEVIGANNGSRPDLLANVDRLYTLSTDATVIYKVQAGVMAVWTPAPELARSARDTGTASFTVANNTDVQILAGSGTITVTLPATQYDGQEFVLAVETAYTAITMSGGARTLIAGAAIGVTAGSFARYRYNAATTTWHRVG